MNRRKLRTKTTFLKYASTFYARLALFTSGGCIVIFLNFIQNPLFTKNFKNNSEALQNMRQRSKTIMKYIVCSKKIKVDFFYKNLWQFVVQSYNSSYFNFHTIDLQEPNGVRFS